MAKVNAKGMVLAAGFGTRLRPLTDTYPKPLIPFLGKCPLQLAIEQLHCAGIRQIAVNTHYLADRVSDFLLRYGDQTVHISHEQEILGTGGAYNPLRRWIGDSHLLVVNGDIVSNINLEKVLTEHISSNAIATMVLLPNIIPGESGVYYQDGQITGIAKWGNKAENSGNFACVQVLSPRFFDYLPTTGSFDIISTAYRQLLEQKHLIRAVIHNGLWHDIRSSQFYFEALSDTALKQFGTKGYQDPSAGIGKDCKIGHDVFIESGVRIGAGSSLERCVLLPGVTLPAGSLVKSQIIGNNFSVDLA